MDTQTSPHRPTRANPTPIRWYRSKYISDDVSQLLQFVLLKCYRTAVTSSDKNWKIGRWILESCTKLALRARQYYNNTSI